MTRTLIAIGCNHYLNMHPLKGAESDAQLLFDALMKPEVGDYDSASSSLLLSPTQDEVREAFKSTLFGGKTPETLTITFAGHGAVSAGSFYMATRDTRPDALSATSFALADLFRMIAEAAPKQTYIIIDACHAGGLTADLNVILKADLIGKLGTPGISLLATAASNEYALEDDKGGIGTSALLACINGEVMLQDTSPVLDLVEIGRAVSTRVSDTGGQTPVVWGLNLYGPPSFCKNPHAGTGSAPLKSLLAAWPELESPEQIRALIQNLWEPYVTISSKWNARAFVDQLVPALGSLKKSPKALALFARRTADIFGAQAASSQDRFREIELRSACVLALLPFADHDAVAEEICSMSMGIADQAEDVLNAIVTSIDDYKFALTTDGLVEFYRLPIKLTRLLGWAGYAYHARAAAGDNIAGAKAILVDLTARLFEIYPLSLVAMSDGQAAPAAIAITALKESNLIEECEQLIGHLFLSVVECGGRLANRYIEPAEILAYLLARENGTLSKNLDLIAQPTELVAVLLRASKLLNLEDEFDNAMITLDHLAINAYLPAEYLGFGAKHIEGGVNLTFRIGHQVWRVDDLEDAWPNFAQPASIAERLAAILSSLVFNDRVAWFLFPRKEEEDAT